MDVGDDRMMFYLSKILPLFVLPLGVTLLLLLGWLALRRRWLVVAALVILWTSSMPLVSGALFRAVEGRSQRLPAAAAPAADAIVVLSIGRVMAPGKAAVSEWSDPDRFFGGVELFEAGKAPLLIFTGGWSPFEPDAPLEGDILAAYAARLGVPAAAIATTARSANTVEEARGVAAVLRQRHPGSPRVLLVTSAFHMRRAAKVFREASMTVVEFPVDFSGRGDRGVAVIDVLPSAGALAQTQAALREMYGRAYYGLMPF